MFKLVIIQLEGIIIDASELQLEKAAVKLIEAPTVDGNVTDDN